MKNLFLTLISILLHQIESSQSFQLNEIANGLIRQQLARGLSLFLIYAGLGLMGALFLVSGIVTLLLGIGAQYDLNQEITFNGSILASITMLIISGVVLGFCARMINKSMSPILAQSIHLQDNGSVFVSFLETLFPKRS